MMAFRPFLCRGICVGNKLLELRIGQLVTDDAGRDLAVEQHPRQILAFGRALDDRGVVIFRHMRALEGDPLNLADVDPIIACQDSAHPGSGRYRITPTFLPLRSDGLRGPRSGLWRSYGAGLGSPRPPAPEYKAFRMPSPACR